MRPPRLGSMSPGAALWPWILGLRLACVHGGPTVCTERPQLVSQRSLRGGVMPGSLARQKRWWRRRTTLRSINAKQREGQGIHLFGLIQSLWLLVSHRLPAQDLLDRTQQPLEGLPVHREELGLQRGRVDAGRAGLVLDESELPEIVPNVVHHYLLFGLPWDQALLCHALAIQNDVKPVAGVALLYDLGVLFLRLNLQSVGYRHHLVGVNVSKHRNLRQELSVLTC